MIKNHSLVKADLHVKHSKTFALIGLVMSHPDIAAIRDNGGVLVSAIDLADSVGILDSYFPHADFSRNLKDLRDFSLKE